MSEWFYMWQQNVEGAPWYFAGYHYGDRQSATMLVRALVGQLWRVTDSNNYDVLPDTPSLMQPALQFPALLQPSGLAQGEEFWWK